MLQLSEIQDLHKKSVTLFPFSNGFETSLLSLRVKNVVIGNASTPTKTADTAHMEIFVSACDQAFSQFLAGLGDKAIGIPNVKFNF